MRNESNLADTATIRASVDSLVRNMDNSRDGVMISIIDTHNVDWPRVDAHVGGPRVGRSGKVSYDCSHYCLPGVPDYWVATLVDRFFCPTVSMMADKRRCS